MIIRRNFWLRAKKFNEPRRFSLRRGLISINADKRLFAL
jgi:hypothetical protein